jgi:hypothetical protein
MKTIREKNLSFGKSEKADENFKFYIRQIMADWRNEVQIEAIIIYTAEGGGECAGCVSELVFFQSKYRHQLKFRHL